MRWACWIALLACSSVTALAQDRALPPEEAAATMQLPPGFNATLFAGEPAIVQPMAFTFDDRGRVWVVENLSYPTWRADNTGHDRVTILEDTDGDGRHDKRTVFLDNGANLSGIEVGFGGVWLTATPNLIFIPDANGDDKPDGPPKILLDGWTLECKHNVVGNLAWGPDGWLYGCHGITASSLVGKPGTPAEKRQTVSCGVWRYHPVRHQFEIYANGTTNPWGIDWDERGELFITNCVIKHIFHVVPGAHYVRMFGQDPNPYVYGLIESCADHQHWAGGHWTTARGGPVHTDFGGGHAHSGCMIYLGDNWPAEYRGNAFLLNIHGQRLNRDILEPHGSSYVAKHAPDFAFSKDPWFRGLHAKYGPDGGVYISDWSDIGECHDNKEEQCDKTGGRIFKIVFGETGAVGNALRGVPSGDLARLHDQALERLQWKSNEWLARHSRRLLQERAATHVLLPHTTNPLRQSFTVQDPSPEEISVRLRALWTLHVIGGLDEDLSITALNAPDETVRSQAVLLAAEKVPTEQVLTHFRHLAENERSTSVRLHLASALQRIPLDDRWPIAQALLAHAEDADDAYLPLMYWYAVEPLVPRNVRKAIELLPSIQIPLVRQYITRRIVAVREGDGASPTSSAWMLDELLRALAANNDTVRLDMLRGLHEAYQGRRAVAAPASWKSTYAALSASANEKVRSDADELGVMYGDRELIARLEETLVRQPRPSIAIRRRALDLLAARHEANLGQALLTLFADLELRPEIIRALAGYDLPEIPPRLINSYASLNAAERQDAIQTLTSRPMFALLLLDAIEANIIPRQDVSALTIRQLQSLADERVNLRLTKVWGAIRRASADKQAKAEQLKSQLTADALQAADLSHGRLVFAKNCATCHKLFGEGISLAPDLTGGQRHNLDYVLDNVLDPSAIVPREYKVHVLRLIDGRVVQGVITSESPLGLTMQTANDTVHVPTSEIEARKESPLSMMPEGLFDRLAADEIRDLVAYLASPQQVPLPATGGPN
jgi:putative membrane-bound dehydrogenase-like protein